MSGTQNSAKYLVNGTSCCLREEPAMQEPQVQSLGQEDPLKKGVSTESNILAWEYH